MTITNYLNMDEDQLIARANDERESLFKRYEQGREAGSKIDAWEDPEFKVYDQIDRYGFIHNQAIQREQYSKEKKLKQHEKEKKWLRMIKKWDHIENEKLKSRIFKGIPDKLRSCIWIKILKIDELIEENKFVYDNMLQLARKWSTDAKQIDSDVNRQFRDHLFFRERYSIKQKSLFNVLTAYSIYNTEVGYCQGMAGVCGVLLMFMDEEQAFWGLNTILTDKKIAMHGFFIEGFPKLMRYTKHLDKILSKLLPKLKKHLDNQGLDSILYSLKWFFLVFVERLPFSLCLRIWDIYLYEGERVLLAMSYTVLKLHRSELLKLKEMDAITTYLHTKIYNDFGYDDDHVIRVLEHSIEKLKKFKLDLPPPAEGVREVVRGALGQFIEPNLDAKIGRRKSIFTDNEKSVTEGVILRQQETAEDLDDNDDCNSQFNGGLVLDEESSSYLGSRKSLTETSIASTADMSTFSGGQISFDDVENIEVDTNIHAKAASAIMETDRPQISSPV